MCINWIRFLLFNFPIFALKIMKIMKVKNFNENVPFSHSYPKLNVEYLN